MHHGENVERDEPIPPPDFDGGEVRGEDGIPVSFQKRGSRWRPLSIRCWFNAVCLQYVGDCRISDVAADVLKCSLNSVVPPRRIFGRKANDGIHASLMDAWATGLAFVAGVELLRDQFPMPTDEIKRRR